MQCFFPVNWVERLTAAPRQGRSFFAVASRNLRQVLQVQHVARRERQAAFFFMASRNSSRQVAAMVGADVAGCLLAISNLSGVPF